MTTTLAALNAADRATFTALLAGIYEDSPWVAEAAWTARPFASLAALRLALVAAVRTAPRAVQLALVCAHPELAGPAAAAGQLTTESSAEQASAGLAPGSVQGRAQELEQELEQLQRLNAAYQARFGWPFILAVRGPLGSGLSPSEIEAALQRRLQAHAAAEFAECLRQIDRIAELRLDDAFGHAPALGRQVLRWADALAEHSDPGYAERGELTVTYLTAAHRACAAQLLAWMRDDCGFDRVQIDAVGNVVAVYDAADVHRALDTATDTATDTASDTGTERQRRAAAPRLLTGSHYDTVRNAGRYDGRLGILVPMACVRELHRAGRRLPFGIEVVAFAEEEGQRYKATFLGSGALTGSFDPAWLEQTDAAGLSMRAAMQAAGLDPAGIGAIERDPAAYLGFVEVHIEQGPVLAELDLPLGVVTSINGSVRALGSISGQASHAGTTPMDRRRDAAAAAAEFVLAVEARALAAAAHGVVATVGMLEVPAGSINVVPGRCSFSLDVRAPNDAVRNACCDAIAADLGSLCQRRGVGYELQETLRVAAAPSDSAWQARWEAAVQRLGLPVHRMASGAGHDAMKLHQRMPQAMLFMRGLNDGISHNPLEAVTDGDTELCTQAFAQLLEALAQEAAAAAAASPTPAATATAAADAA